MRSSMMLLVSLSLTCLLGSGLGFPGAPQKSVQEQKRPVKTVRVTCHSDSLEVFVQADLFAVGALVHGEDLHLGVTPDDLCTATPFSEHEYRIVAGLQDCGTKHWMTEDTLAYTNLLIYSPGSSEDGLVRMDDAVIPIECHYKRRFSLSSAPIAPTWTFFTSKRASEQSLDFSLRIMTNDLLYQRSSNVFHMGEPIALEASVRVSHHTGLRVFVNSCVATLDPDATSDPKYVFIEQGCLTDSQYPGSGSQFLARTQDDKLYFFIEAFRFHNRDQAQLFISCQLAAVPVSDAEALSKACTLVNGRWRSADGNDYLCGFCRSQNEPKKTSKGPAPFGPRGMGRPAPIRSEERAQEVLVGPLTVLPAWHRSLSLPEDDARPVLHKLIRPVQYGSQWKSGLGRKAKNPEPSPARDDDVRSHKMKSTENDSKVWSKEVQKNSTWIEVTTPRPEVNASPSPNKTLSESEYATLEPKK